MCELGEFETFQCCQPRGGGHSIINTLSYILTRRISPFNFVSNLILKLRHSKVLHSGERNSLFVSGINKQIYQRTDILLYPFNV